MGIKPGELCHLEKEKLIDVQENFVDTFNWLVDFCDNLKGDADEDGGAKAETKKHITVDTTLSDQPVIRFSGTGEEEEEEEEASETLELSAGAGITIEDVTAASGSGTAKQISTAAPTSGTIVSGNDSNVSGTFVIANNKATITLNVYYV